MRVRFSISFYRGLKKRIRLFSVLVLAFLPFLGMGQNSVPVTDTLKASGDTLRFSQNMLVPFSLKLECEGELISEMDWEINWAEGYALLTNPKFEGKPVIARYRHFPNALEPKFAYQQLKITRDSTGEIAGFEVIGGNDQNRYTEDFFANSNVNKSGSISRGITVGNNQNLSVSSGLRLQLEGDLGDDLKLVAAITDENIPIQPDGTTQQIQDFDKVFVKLIKGNSNVILGDFEINHQGTQFANFYRNVQGIGVRIRDEKHLQVGMNGAVAKGKFHTNTFTGRDGVNGPYRLTGRNNERFIIVLAGSEKVYLNGQLQTRGEGNDYTIDYNTGELTFTSQVVITSASRIVVDFEYTDRFYNRSLFFVDFENKFFNEKLNVKFSYGRDADNQNAPVEGEYSDPILEILRDAGDSTSQAFTTGVDTVGPAQSANAVQYARNDTTINGFVFERYVYSTDTNIAIYRIAFSYVGPGNGFYVKEQNAVNGTVFSWVAPDTAGNPTGDYLPVRQLVLPRLLQVADVKLDYKLGKKATIYTEMAISSEDKNRFSPFDDNDNFDMANKTGIVLEKIRLGDSLTMKVDVSHRFVGERYENLDRVYKVEYGREWNFDDLGERLTENVSEGIVEFDWKNQVRVRANAGVRTFGDRLFSVKQTYEAESRHKAIQGTYKFTTISTQDKLTGIFSRWNRHNGDIYKGLGKKDKVRIGSEIWMEDKSREIGDSTLNGAFRFYDLKPYIKTAGTEKFQAHLYYNYRREYEFLDTLYRDKSVAHTEYVKLIYNPISNLSFQNTTSYRQFDLLDEKFETQGLSDKNSFITNLQGTWFTNSRIVFTNLIYEVTQEQVAQKEVAYIEVNEGQGQYEWLDYNENGVQELDEFQISTNPLRANFIRVLVPTRDLFPTTGVNFSGNFKIDLKRAFDRSKNPIKETIRNFISITNFRVTQQREAGTGFDNYIISLNDMFGDTTLLDAQYNLREDVYFFRNNKVGDLKFSFSDNKSKLFLATGDEIRGLRTWLSAQRLNLGKSKSIENEARIGRKYNSTESFSTRDFDIAFWEVNPKVNFQLSRKARISFGYEYKNKKNRDDSLFVDTKVTFHKLIADAKINFKDRNNLFTKLELIRIAQEGTASFSAEYELRESLKPGFNAIWQAFLTFYINKSLELSLNYDGRISEGSNMLHTGRVQIKAFF